MKLRIQLKWSSNNPQEIENKRKKLSDFVSLLELELLKGELYNPKGDICVVQLPTNVPHANLILQAVSSYCLIFGHVCDLKSDSYPVEKVD